MTAPLSAGRPWLQAFVLLVAASGAGAFANAVRPGAIPWVVDEEQIVRDQKAAEIGLEPLQILMASGAAVLVDARKPEEFAEGHLAGAINIPSTEKEAHVSRIMDIAAVASPDLLVVVYCGGGDCEASHEVYDYLLSYSIPREFMKVYKPGWEELRKHDGLPKAYGME